MTGTQLEAFINFLVSTFSTGKVAGYALQVIDGPGAADIRNNVLFVGHSLISPTYSGTATQQWATLGKTTTTRKEQLEVTCSLRVGIGNKDMAGCRQRACSIFDALAVKLRQANPATLPGDEFQQVGLSRYRLYQEYTTDGVSVIVDFTATATARI